MVGGLSALLAGGSLFFAVWSLYFLLNMYRERSKTRERVSRWIKRGSDVRWSDSLVEWLDQMAWAKKLQPKLERASVRLRPAEYGGIVLVGGFLFGLLLSWFLEINQLICLVIGLSLAPVASNLFLLSRRHLYVSKIDNQLPEACRLLSSAARAGLSIPQGLELAVKELPSPIRKELEIVVQELQLGRHLEGALQELLKRVYSQDLHVFVNALIIQQRSGGDLARVMAQMASTMEERKIISQIIRSVTAQARYSAYMLPVISVFIVFMMSRMIDGFFDLFTTFFGMIIAGIFIVLQIVGVLLVRKISNIEI
ncbi:tight adherence protein B [Planifilum fulgidum]|jgi:tight adherence protein B|uniref:Tight adherence protein B n=1 Tax=Planifilum fulgidum TaxID=201973 RepID=A0A1I2T214_9BACL|nr:type II secretion system F family protein [Planifilum fulgidum]SFG58189.1 tight adherence protein B [Planifilum fulgidum]